MNRSTETALEQVRRQLDHADEAPTLDALARAARLSPSHL